MVPADANLLNSETASQRLVSPLPPPPSPPTDPSFVHVHLIPDSAERNDDKLYFFFREKSSEMGQSPVTQSRIGRICLVCTHGRACVPLCRKHSGRRKRLVKKKGKKKRKSPEAAHPPSRSQCLANADVPESTCVFNLPVYNASLSPPGRPTTPDPSTL